MYVRLGWIKDTTRFPDVLPINATISDPFNFSTCIIRLKKTFFEHVLDPNAIGFNDLIIF